MTEHYPWGDLLPPRFFGKVEGETFTLILLTPGFRNSWRPRLRGTLTPGEPAEGMVPPERTVVRGTLTLHPIIACFSAVWLSGAAVGAVVVAYEALRRGEPIGAVALLLPLAGFALMFGAFLFDAHRSFRALRETLGAVDGALCVVGD